MDTYVDVAALGQVLLTSLLAGAGLVACFALGIVGWSVWEADRGGNAGANGRVATPGGSGRGRAAGLALAAVCFTIVVAGVAFGILTILNKS